MTILEEALDWGTLVSAPDKTITYYLYEPGEVTPYGGTSVGWTADEADQIRAAFDLYESFLDVTFELAEDSGDADFHLVTFNSSGGTLGRMSPPGEPEAGLGEFNKFGTGWDNALDQGGHGFVTIIHEFGHGLGLAHPHDGGGPDDDPSPRFPGVTSAFNDYGNFDLNQGVYTTMSYNDGWDTNPDGESPSLKYGYQGTPMALDIAVLQAKYGANTDHNTNDNVYSLPDSNGKGTFYAAIWDAGGTDAIVYSGSRDANIDLRPATLEVEKGGGGFLSYAEGIFGGFTIANAVAIENASGGDGNDVLTGNDLGNEISGGKGKDVLKGRSGEDVLAGENGKDLLKGGAKDDLLMGGKGDDVLKGGSGRDDFFFAENPGKGVDVIMDFQAGERIVLDQSAFELVDLGVLDTSAFRNGANAKTEDHRIVYKEDKGKIFRDEDGVGGESKVLFAQVDPNTMLSASDFFVI